MDPVALRAAVRAHESFAPVSRALARGTTPDDHLYVTAVSGGGDSTALALLVGAWLEGHHRMLLLAYFDHAVDPQRHAAEWQHVRSLARLLGVPAVKGASAKYGHINGRSLEEAWRNRRYAFLSTLAGGRGVVLTGHTMDDVAETFLMAAIRGGSGAAMAGPRPHRSGTLRPLLGVRRDTLRDLLRTVGVGWIEDPSNAGGNARALTRSYLLPVVTQRFGPRAVIGLARSAALVEEWSDAADAEAREVSVRAVTRSRNGTFLDLQTLEGYPRAVRRRVLRHTLIDAGSATGLLSAAVDDLLELCEGPRSRRLQLPCGMEAIRSGPLVRIAPRGPIRRMGTVHVPLPGRVATGSWVLSASTVWTSPDRATRFPGDTLTALLDRDEVCEPLFLRGRQPGDSLVPLGMAGRVKLKKYMRDHGVPRWERWSTPVVCDASGRVLWLPGIVRSRDARVGTKTKHIVVLHGTRAAKEEEERGA